MDLATQRLMSGAAGASGDPLYVEDAFSCHLYTGTGSAQTINNGIDLASKGGLVIIKNRTSGGNLYWFDTERGAGKYFATNVTNENGDSTSYLSSFNSNGFSLGNDNDINSSGQDYVSWTFRKVDENFTMVQYTVPSGGAAFTVNHDLGRTPKQIIIRRVSGDDSTFMFHYRMADPPGTNDWRYIWKMTGLVAPSNFGSVAMPSDPTSTQFSIGTHPWVNQSGVTYQAYLWSDGSVFGENADKQIYYFNSFNGTGVGDSGYPVNTYREPQFVFIKNNGNNRNSVHDLIRGLPGSYNLNSRMISWNDTQDEQDSKRITIDRWSSLGFRTNTSNNEAAGMCFYWVVFAPNAEIGRPPEVGTDNFGMTYGTSGSNPSYQASFQVDWAFQRRPTSNEDWYTANRKLYGQYQKLNSDSAKTNHTGQQFDFNTGWHEQNYNLTPYLSWMFKQGHGFDVSVRSGRSGYTAWPHNLLAVPEMIWYKNITDSNTDWYVYHKGLNGGTNPHEYYLKLNTNAAEVNDTSVWHAAPSSSQMSGGNIFRTTYKQYVGFLFSSVENISKVGYYDGSSSTVTITTGFQPRFVIIKRATGVGQWSVFDTTRGWAAGNDQLLELSDPAAQSNSFDAGAPTSTGFTVTSGQSAINGNGDKYIYYAHA